MNRPPQLDELLAGISTAVARVDDRRMLSWLCPAFAERVGVPVRLGDPVEELLAPGPAREELLRALGERRVVTFTAVSRGFMQLRLQIRPAEPGALLFIDPDPVEDRVAFAQALQEIARAVGETLDVDGACAAAAVSMVRSAQVVRADVFLVDADGEKLRRVASSNAAGGTPPPEENLPANESVRLAVATGQPQIGVAAGLAEGMSALFAAVPVAAQRKAVGVLVLFKARGTGFSARELELWAAAGGQLAVAVENGRLYREVQRALQIREDFMSIASHELRTPLTALSMQLDGIERRLLRGEPVGLPILVKSKRQVHRLANLVGDLLDATRLERGRLAVRRAPLELGRLVLDVVDAFRTTHGRHIDLVVPPQKIWVLGDRDRLEQVLVNLLQNAVKYSPARTPVVVEVQLGAGVVSLSIEDEGIGIPVQDRERVFERFYRAQNASARNFGGLGLGLYITRAILHLHGGELKLQSEEGLGTVFTAIIPRLSLEQIAQLRRRVLLVDDDPNLRAAANTMLGDAGFEVLQTRSPSEALAQLAQHDVDCVLASATLHETAAEMVRQTVETSFASRPIALVVSGEQLPRWAAAGTPLCRRPYDRHELPGVITRAMAVGDGGPWSELP